MSKRDAMTGETVIFEKVTKRQYWKSNSIQTPQNRS